MISSPKYFLRYQRTGDQEKDKHKEKKNQKFKIQIRSRNQYLNGQHKKQDLEKVTRRAYNVH